jgi:hypothetical protein
MTPTHKGILVDVSSSGLPSARTSTAPPIEQSASAANRDETSDESESGDEKRTESDQGLRVMLYDRTCIGAPLRPGLTHAWWCGARIYRALRRLDRWHGVASWAEGLAWLAQLDKPIAEIQYWGHGHWGNVWIAKDRFDERDLLAGSEHHTNMIKIRDNLCQGSGLIWMRTCETFGARAGHSFAAALADFFRCRAAGHTYIIGPWQSGLHCLNPGMEPTWSAEEGLREGNALAPKRAKQSSPLQPNTIFCLQGRIPAGF